MDGVAARRRQVNRVAWERTAEPRNVEMHYMFYA